MKARKPRAKSAPREVTCKVCEVPFTTTAGRATMCAKCRASDKHRNGARAAKIPTIAWAIDNEGKQEGEGDTANMRGTHTCWGLENGESGSYVWNWGDDAPYVERGAVGALLYLCKMAGELYELQQPWRDHPAGTKVRLAPVSFHFNYDACILLKDFDNADMEVVRKAQRRLSSAICRADHDPDDCDKLCDEAKLDALIEEERQKAADGGASAEEDAPDTFKGIVHYRDAEDIDAVLIEGGESDLAAWDRRSKLAVCFTPRRRFYAEIRPNGDRYEEWHGRLDIHDTGSAFVGGLEKAIGDWNPPITDAQRAAIKWGKQARKDGFDGGTDDEISAYSEAECVAHAMMCRQLVDSVKDAAGVPMALKDLYGSGSVAKACLDHHKVPRRGLGPAAKQASILEFEELGQLTYFGGLIATPMIGRIPERDAYGRELVVVGQDINSAYPDKFVDVPCMRRVTDEDGGVTDCGEFRTIECKPGARSARLPDAKHVIGHVLVDWDILVPDADGNVMGADGVTLYKSPTSTPPFVVRAPNMGVYHPARGYEIWVSLAEFRTARKRFGKKVQAHRIVYYVEKCVCGNPRPLAFVAGMYDERSRIKAEADAARVPGDQQSQEFWELWCRQLSIKLIINSIYGKFGQMRPAPGAYTNLHIASYITGATRAQMREKIWDIEDRTGQVAYVHTDGVYASVALDKGETVEQATERLGMGHEGDQLGQWGAETPSRDMLLWQPGLTLARQKLKGGKWVDGGKSASRGINSSVWEPDAGAHLDRADRGEVDFTDNPTHWEPIRSTDRTMYGLRKARALGKPHLAGTFQDVTKTLYAVPTKQEFGHTVVKDNARRDYSNAVQVDGIPTLWTVPPVTVLTTAASLSDIKQYRTALDKRYRRGEFDTDAASTTDGKERA